MELKHILLLGICLVCVTGVSGVYDASGDDADGSDAPTTASADDIQEGSGMELDSVAKECVGLRCWCVYTDGTKVPNSEAFASYLDCSMYAGQLPTTTGRPTTGRPTTATSTSTVLPTRAKQEPQPHNVITQTEIEDSDDITFVDTMEPVSVTPARGVEPETGLEVTDDSDDQDIDNKIDPNLSSGKADKEKPVDEETEEESNELPGATRVNRERLVNKEDLASQPGILAALIGGSVVLFLCAVLLVLFIIYRMKKKDEGSYPLGDEKPLKNYAYSKAPSREFFA